MKNTKESRIESRNAQFTTLLKNGYVQETYNDLDIFTKAEGKYFALKIYSGTAAKPIENVLCQTPESRQRTINRQKENYDRIKAYKASCKANPIKSTSANCAAAIRTELKTTFEGIKFSVTASNFSGGNSVRIEWVDGPTTDEVSAIVSKYQYGRFDGMNDIYEHTNSREDIPQAKYIQTSRSKSPEVQSLLPELEKMLGTYESDWHNRPEAVLYRLFNKTSIPCGLKAAGIERTETDCGLLEDFFRIKTA